MTRPSRYSPELVARIVRALELGGTDNEAAELAGIAEATFYRWLDRYPEFAEKVEAAKAGVPSDAGEVDHALAKLQARKQWADAWIDNILQGKAWRRKEYVNRSGQVTRSEREQVLPDRWLIDRVLGEPDIEERFELIIGNADPELPDEED